MTAGVQGYRYVLTVVDPYSRFVRFFPLKTKDTQHIIQHMWQYVADYGTARDIVMDNGGEFTSKDFQDFCTRHTITACYTTPHHPQGNGIIERMHRTLKSVLAALCQGHPLRWPNLLQPCQVIMNQAVHTSTGQQPYFAYFSRHPPRLVSASLPSVDGEADELAKAHALVRETHQKMSRRYRDAANSARKNQEVEKVDLVWVKGEVLVPGTCKKLNPMWHGVDRMEEVTLDGSVFVVKNIFTGQVLQRAAAQVKPYFGKEEWLVEPPSGPCEPNPEDEPLPPRVRRPPKRYIEECLVEKSD